MEAIHNLLRRRVHEHNGKLDDLVQVGPRVLFARALEVQHTDYSRGGSNWWWWGWRRPRPLALLASLASSGLDARQSGAFRGERCYCCRGEEGEAHGVQIDVRALILQDCPEVCTRRLMRCCTLELLQWLALDALSRFDHVLLVVQAVEYDK